MKFKSFVKFITGTVVIGAAAITLMNTLQKKSELNNQHVVKNTNVNVVNRLISEEKYNEEQKKDYTVKETVGIVIVERHEKASEVVKEALLNINSMENQSNDRAFEDLTKDIESLMR
ncbi:hypothetical protein [Lysinibacillus fusiformis]|uniref:hypothetical protein n=1 Tax=Lysinibacillus fusiformis TaxID=28031 RepID=UPI003665F686